MTLPRGDKWRRWFVANWRVGIAPDLHHPQPLHHPELLHHLQLLHHPQQLTHKDKR